MERSALGVTWGTVALVVRVRAFEGAGEREREVEKVGVPEQLPKVSLKEGVREWT